MQKFFSIAFFTFFLSLHAFAQMKNAPPSFDRNGVHAVFVDFQSAKYDITFDAKSKTAWAISEIKFQSEETGSPIFYFTSDDPFLQVTLDGSLSSTVAIQPDPANWDTTFNVIQRSVQPGVHILVVKSKFEARFRNSLGPEAAWRFLDASSVKFLDRWLPSNSEYDQYQMDFNIHFTQAPPQQVFFTNGDVRKVSAKDTSIHYPSYFTTSSIFFQTGPASNFTVEHGDFLSISGAHIPVTLYTDKVPLTGVMDRIYKHLTDLESHYGAWPHPLLLVSYGHGAMEYSGALETDSPSLKHEMTHSYFARGVMPANGNAGWIDEAVVVWSIHPPNPLPIFVGKTALAGRNPYVRDTPFKSFIEGQSFMSHLDYLLQNKGGLLAFLNVLAQSRMHQAITTEEFQAEVENFYGGSLSQEFDFLYHGNLP